jgi:proline racemase
MINVVDSHTEGEPTRVVVGGIPKVPGKTMAEKLDYFKKNFDHIRTSLMQEPRGHMAMFGALLISPANEEADFGVLFINGATYEYMCGHGSIGVATVIVETGMVEVKEPITTITLDTLAGTVKAYVHVAEGAVKSVTIRNVPSFHYKSTVIDVPGIGKTPMDISFGGNFYPIINAKDIGVKVDINNSAKLAKIGLDIRSAVNKEVKVQHPEKHYINKVKEVRIYDEATHPEAHSRNIVIFGDGQIDRSPCGTGTSAHMAVLHSKGKLKLDEESVHESVIGTIFRGKLIGTAKVGEYDAVIPEITGNAYITGFHSFVIDPKDPLKHGFRLQ